jgi:ABC-type transport system involved in multi-copper enzyme maturation permease subunit
MMLIVLITNTFRELLAKATLVVLASISTLIIVVTLLSFSSQTTSDGVSLMMFGTPVSPALPLDKVTEFVQTVQVGMAKGMFAGVILFGIFATAGIIPDTLQKGTIDLYLSKPIARWELLLGKYFGGVAVMLANVVYFVGALFLIFGVKTGVWNVGFLFSTLSMTFAFACLFSLVVFLGMIFRNVAIPMIGSFLYLMVISGILQQREATLYLISENGIYRGFLDTLYYLLPQISALQENIANQIMHTGVDWKPFVFSLGSSCLLLGGAAAAFSRRDF